MLLLAMMVLMGLLIGTWGFTACFFPDQSERFSAALGFIDRWTPGPAKGAHRIKRIIGRAVGLVFLAVGGWFAFEGISNIYLVFTKRATIHPVSSVGTQLPNSSPLPLTALPVLVLLIGLLAAVFPEKAVAVSAFVFPPWRAMSPVRARRVRLYTRLSGLFFAVLAAMSLLR